MLSMPGAPWFSFLDQEEEVEVPRRSLLLGVGRRNPFSCSLHRGVFLPTQGWIVPLSLGGGAGCESTPT